MADVVILVPYRPDGDRRDLLWKFTLDWLIRHHNSWPVITGASPDGPFNRGAAVNAAAREAGDFDVAIIHDADTIASPTELELAVERAAQSGGVCYPYETYTYLDEWSTEQLMATDPPWGPRPPRSKWFLAPERHADGFARSVRHHHVSGIQAVSRKAWDKVGGFIELDGWGAEDQIMACLFNIFGSGLEWLQGGAYHLWHEARRNDPDNPHDVANHQILTQVLELCGNPDELRRWLQAGGHPIP